MDHGKSSAGSHGYLLVCAVTAALTGILLGFGMIVISGAGEKIQSIWVLGGFMHGLCMSAALSVTVLGIVFGGWPPERFGRRKTLFAIAAVLFCASSVRSAEDILIADFEGDTYGDWTVTGEAFGPGPDKGTVEGKLKVVGFRGKGFANSCWNDFLGRGTLTSPKFKIQRKYIGFLVCGGSGIIGSGSNDGRTFVNLLVDGKVVHSLHPTGISRSTPDRRKGVETMLPVRWDVSDLMGKEAVVQIIDHQSNHLARINVDHIYQSDTERTFAEDLEKNEAIKVYAKLPGWFQVLTPLGTYNPDWAVLVENDGGEHLYFVVETKGSLSTDDLRNKERAKIQCGKAHFNALAVREAPAKYVVKTSVDGLLAEV